MVQEALEPSRGTSGQGGDGGSPQACCFLAVRDEVVGESPGSTITELLNELC